MFELSFKVSEKFTHQFESQTRFQLLKELLALLNPVLVLEGLCLNIDLDAVIKKFGQLLLLLHLVQFD
jgi:hypothetical protein